MQATFENLPLLVQRLNEKVDSLFEELIDRRENPQEASLLTFSQFCKKVMVSHATGYRIAKKVPHIKRGKNLLFEEEDVEAWLQSQKKFPNNDLSKKSKSLFN